MTGIGGDEDYQEIDTATAQKTLKQLSNISSEKKSLITVLRRVIFRGGVGSGHFDHAGRPGEVGGSQPGKGSGEGKKKVGLTSARPGRDAPEIVLEDMNEFEDSLKSIDGVSNAEVEFGEGGWEGGSEPTWVVSYDGNGDALKLIASIGKQFNQDGVLLYESCDAGCSPVVTWTFGDAISLSERDAIQDILVERGIGGWTWYNDGGQAALRAVSVPQWGGRCRNTFKRGRFDW